MQGRVITFYSYKGGTGRSMLLANVAWILASNGKRVLAIDWDLEAPGLHRYFGPFLVDKDMRHSEGVIDFAIDFSVAAVAAAHGGEAKPGWQSAYANIGRYAASVDWDFSSGGTLDFVGAGRQGASYATRVNGFKWPEFYEQHGGGALLDEMRELVKSRYDYVLVDSRTGVSDTSGICTLHLPDTLVTCFTLNNQSVDGAAAVSQSAHEQRESAGRPLRILPVPTRIDTSEQRKLALRKARAIEKFGRFRNDLSLEDPTEYWADVELPYIAYYAYEETLGVFESRPGRVSILRAAERLTARLTGGEVTRAERPSEAMRVRALAGYEGRDAPPATLDELAPPGGIYISYRRSDAASSAARLYDELTRRFGDQRVSMDFSEISPGLDFVSLVERAVASSSAVVAVIGPEWVSATGSDGQRRLDDPYDVVRQELGAALRAGTRVIPVLVEGARLPGPQELPPELKPLVRRQALELTSTAWLRDVARLEVALDLAVIDTQTASESRPSLRDAERSVSRVQLFLIRRRWAAVAAGASGVAIGVVVAELLRQLLF